MKKQLMKAAGVAMALFLLHACSKNLQDKPEQDPASALNSKAAPVANDRDGLILHEFLKSQGPKFEYYDIKAEGDVIKTKDGAVFTFPQNSLILPSGAPASGIATIAIKRISRPSDMVLDSKPTTTTTGAPLISYGEFFIGATQGSQQLRLRPGNSVTATVPGIKIDNVRQIPMWDGDTSVLAVYKGYNYRNQIDSVIAPFSANRGVEWRANGNVAAVNPTTQTATFRIDTLFRWANCDALMGTPGPKTTVLGYFSNFYNGATDNSFGGLEPTMLFFKPANLNTVIKFSTPILIAPAGFKGFLSYQNSIPIGQAGTFLAVSALNGNFYAELRSVTIPAPPAGQNYVSFSFVLQPVSASQLLTLITNLNSL